jgi:hypothetical protein
MSYVVDGSGSGSSGDPALCSNKPYLVNLKTSSDICEPNCYALRTSWFSTFGQRLGYTDAIYLGCVNGNYTFQYTPITPAVYHLDLFYNGQQVKTGGNCDCPTRKNIGIVVDTCNRCAAPDKPCDPPTTKQYDVENNVPGYFFSSLPFFSFFLLFF